MGHQRIPQPPQGLRFFLVATCAIGFVASTAIISIGTGNSSLPASDSKAGQMWLEHYNLLSHGLVLLAVALMLLWLWAWALREPPAATSPGVDDLWGSRILRWCRQHPLLLILYLAYGLSMVRSTTGFYPELQGWLRDVHADQLLNPFVLRDGLISETMRANSFRFFPLAHQDLHLLSWLTPYVKVWVLVSALELFAIVLLVNRAVTVLVQGKERPGQLWLISLVLLFHPATGWAFFQLIYSERLLTLLFVLFINAALSYQSSHSRRAFALCFGCALVGIFVKDIAVILFVIPAGLSFLLAVFGLGVKPSRSYALEWWLCGLSIVAVVAYLVLSLLPSLYVGSNGFDHSDRFTVVADWRLIALGLFTLIRWLLIARRRCQANLLDGLNLAALAYAMALFLSVGYPYESFWTLPVQLVAVMDFAFVWSLWVAPALSGRAGPATIRAIGMGVGLGVLALENNQPHTFAKRVSKIQMTQKKWQSSFEQLEALLKARRRTGEARNLIYMQTWFGRPEYARLPYERLIELNPDNGSYIVVDGIGSGEPYAPKSGDLLANIDKRKLSVLGQDSANYTEIYRFREGMNYGAIYERHP